MAYVPQTEAQLAAAKNEYSETLLLANSDDEAKETLAAFREWCLTQPHGAAPFNDHSWLAWTQADRPGAPVQYAPEQAQQINAAEMWG